MAASLDSMGGKPADNSPIPMSNEEELDLEIAVKLSEKMLMEGGGIKVIADALRTSQSPSQVVGQFFAQMFAQMQESFPQGMEISPNVWLAKGGVLEQLLDFLETKLGLPKDFSDKIYNDTLEVIKAAAQGSENAPQQDQGQPSLDQQGGMMQQGGMSQDQGQMQGQPQPMMMGGQ